MEVERIGDWRGQDVVDSEGEKIGKLDDVYYDIDSREPVFAGVKSGVFGRALSFVPLADVRLTRDEVRVAYAKVAVKDSPDAGATPGELSDDDEAALFSYYGLGRPPAGETLGPGRARYQTEGAEAGRAEAAAAARQAEQDAAARADEADAARRRAVEQGAVREDTEYQRPAAAGSAGTPGVADAGLLERVAELERRVAELEARAV